MSSDTFRFACRFRRTCAAVLIVAFAALTSPAHGQHRWGGSIGITNDYRVRGVAQSLNEPAVQAGLHRRLGSRWVAGVWASTIKPNRTSSASAEVDGYVGVAWSFARNWDAKVTLTHYWYPSGRTRYDYDEISASLMYRAQFAATVSWSPNTAYASYYGNRWSVERGASASYELTGLQPLTSSLSLTAGVGYNDLHHVLDRGYWYWNGGVSYAIGPVRLDVSRIDSDASAERVFGTVLTDAGWSAALSWRF